VHSDPPVFPGRIDPSDRFRERRRRSQRRRRIRRLVAFVLIVGAVVALALNARFIGGGGGDEEAAAGATTAGATTQASAKQPVRALPDEIRGVHMTIGLASIKGKLDEFISYRSDGLNAIQLDVKDENGTIGFVSPAVPLAREIGAQSSRYYNARKAARKIHDAGLYLIGRVVVFQDPTLVSAKPGHAIKTPSGAVWQTDAGAGWANPYDEEVWDYNVAVAVAAAKAGFDEIMFDYVRFPTDGTAPEVYPGKRSEPRWQTIASFVEYATEQLEPYGVQVSAALFGLSATRDMGIGQRPSLLGKYLDTIYPMVYPSHYGSGEFNIDNPDAQPGRTVSFSLLDFRQKLQGRQARIVPWLQDFSLGRTYTLADVEQQIAAARRAKSSGFLLWNAGGIYTTAALKPR
jgi:hypothetical protein